MGGIDASRAIVIATMHGLAVAACGCESSPEPYEPVRGSRGSLAAAPGVDGAAERTDGYFGWIHECSSTFPAGLSDLVRMTARHDWVSVRSVRLSSATVSRTVANDDGAVRTSEFVSLDLLHAEHVIGEGRVPERAWVEDPASVVVLEADGSRYRLAPDVEGLTPHAQLSRGRDHLVRIGRSGIGAVVRDVVALDGSDIVLASGDRIPVATLASAGVPPP